MDKTDRIKQFIDEFQMENLTKKYLYKRTWTSGSCTEVYPIMVWENDITIQWDCDKRIFDKFINRIVEKYNDLFEWGCFWKTDGSCPSTITFKFREKITVN